MSIGLASGAWPSQLRADEQADTRRTALQPMAFRPLPLGQVKPSGWLREQLKTQAAGLSGHLDEFWPDIKNSAWIGGNAEGWERVPYWLDGVVPLAYLLDDQGASKPGSSRFVDSILEHQQPDGWLGPVGDTAGHQPYDVWPLFPLFKALTSTRRRPEIPVSSRHYCVVLARSNRSSKRSRSIPGRRCAWPTLR